LAPGLVNPSRVAVSNDGIFVSDLGDATFPGSRILKFDHSGVFQFSWDVLSRSPHLELAMDSNGHLLVSESNGINCYSSTTGSIIGKISTTAAAYSIAAGQQFVYVFQEGSNQIQKYCYVDRWPRINNVKSMNVIDHEANMGEILFDVSGGVPNYTVYWSASPAQNISYSWNLQVRAGARNCFAS